MPEYTYTGINRQGQRVTGKVEVADEGQLRMRLRAEGIRPTRVAKVGTLNRDLGSMLGGGQSVPQEVLVSMTRQLTVLLSSGIPLLQSLDAIADQTANRNLKNILLVVRERVSQGTYLWESLAQYPKVFPKLYIAMIRAGEASGSLDTMLSRISRYLEDSQRLKKTVKSAMIYPVMTIAVGIAVMGGMLAFVIPKFEEMLKGAGQDLPAPTKFVLMLSHAFTDNLVLVLGGGAVGFYLLYKFFTSSEGRAVRDRLLYRAPIFGELMQKAGIARFSRTMQTLLSSGVSLIDAIDICRSTIDNAVIESALAGMRANIETGKTLGAVAAKLQVFPRMAVQMIAIGESTGNLDNMLDKVADFYEEEVEVFVAGISKLIEPVVLVVLGGLVGGMLIAMYLPIFKLAGGA